MTGLPQGVTLEPWPNRDDLQRRFPDDMTVRYLGETLGSVWEVTKIEWQASSWATGELSTPRFRSRDAAARWVCLQARPVVYQVRRRTLNHAGRVWQVIDDQGQVRGAPWVGHGNAMTIAARLAHHDLRARGMFQ